MKCEGTSQGQVPNVYLSTPVDGDLHVLHERWELLTVPEEKIVYKTKNF
jgi:hypothetical protein